MGLFGMGSKEITDNWLETVTMEELENMESQGLDVSEWKKIVSARLEGEKQSDEARFNSSETDNKNLDNPIDLSKLKNYDFTPRDTNSEFVRAVAGKLPFFGKDKLLNSIANSPLLYVSIVQANNALWEAGNNEYLPAVIVFATDEAHKKDIAWLKNMAKTIADMKNATDIPSHSQKLISVLRDDQSDFCCKIAAEISDGADAWCSVYSFPNQALLPKKHLPSEGIVPLLLKEGPKEDLGTWFYMIPGEFYKA